MNTFLTSVYKGETPALDQWLKALGGDFPLLHELAQTPQDPEWHAEGDVFIHTSMVLEETYKRLNNEAADLDADRRFVLVLSAVLHDIAKPLTTREQELNGVMRIMSPRHADRGRSWLAYKLVGHVPDHIAQQVLALVGHHHDLLRLVAGGKHAGEYRRLARHVDTELLYHLEAADVKGRISLAKGREIEQVEMFRLYCEEYGAWTRDPYAEWTEELYSLLDGIDPETQRFIADQSVRDYEEGRITTPHEAVARSFGYRASYPRLVVTCGPGGSGKSTWINTALGDYHIVSLDELRKRLTGSVEDQSKNGLVLQTAKEQLKEHLRRKHNVVWDATNLRRELRGVVLGLGFDYHAHVTLVAFQMHEREVFRRNSERERKVPHDVLVRQIESMEWPYAYEAHKLVVV